GDIHCWGAGVAGLGGLLDWLGLGFVAGWAGAEGLYRGHEFSWDPSIASLVKKEWQSKCAPRFSGIVSKVCIDPTYATTWCAPTLRAYMMKIRAEDEDFKRRSRQCSKNRLRNESQRVHHRQGSISAKEVKINMKKKAANLECEDETQKKSEDELFFKVVGGLNEKGRIFGLGAAARSYYDRPTYEEKNERIRSNKARIRLDKASIRTQQVPIETKKTLTKTTESFMTFKEQVEKFMQANPTRS
ncbi:Peptide methionine sulfoxide reductase MsrA 1, partial [Bienertia sinuspersici]